MATVAVSQASGVEHQTAAPQRIASLDLLRGAVMVLMAIDHVRVYAGVPAGGPTPGIFFTRWVTHFCAPAFVFFAGTAAFLQSRRIGAPALARFLVTRGLLLVALELTVIRASWTFTVDYSQFILAGVIWMLGWCMVLLAGLIWLPVGAIAAAGLLVIALQGAFGSLGAALPAGMHPVWEFIYPIGSDVRLGAAGPTVTVLYTIVPWIGVMAAGYAFGAVMTSPPAERSAWCLRVGLSATALFVAAAAYGALTARGGPAGAPFVIRMLNQRKYPASPLFLLMTLGPALVLLPVAERARGWVAGLLTTFGRVPLFYYLLHIPLIHLLALMVWLARGGAVHADRFATAPYVSIPPEARWSLPLLYLVCAVVVAILYPVCRRYARAKREARQRWMRYI